MSERRHQVVRNGLVLTPGAPQAAPLDVLIEDGRIRELGPRGMAAPVDAELIDADDRLVVPGLVNAHTHAHGGLGKGAVGDRLPLEVFLTGSGAGAKMARGQRRALTKRRGGARSSGRPRASAGRQSLLF